MKRLIISGIAIIAALMGTVNASAQVYDGPRFGIIGGITSSSSTLKNVDAKSLFLYHAGLTAELPIGLGFAIQPSLEYQVKGVAADKIGDSSVNDVVNGFEAKAGFIEVPVQIQWGPDLVAFRPYAFAEPFVGYRIGGKASSDGKYDWSAFTNDLKKIEYGLGVGAGIDIWKLQVSAKYFWNFGEMGAAGSGSDAVSTVKNAFKDGNNFNGIIFSLAFFF